MHARGARLDHPFHELECVQRPAEPGLRIGDDRGEPVRVALALGPLDLVGARERVVEAPDCRGDAVRRIEALIRIDLPREVPVGGHLPAGEVDRLEPGLHHLDGLAARDGSERAHVSITAQKLPEALRAELGQGVLDMDRAAEPDDVLRSVRPLDARPALALPRSLECAHLSVELAHASPPSW